MTPSTQKQGRGRNRRPRAQKEKKKKEAEVKFGGGKEQGGGQGGKKKREVRICAFGRRYSNSSQLCRGWAGKGEGRKKKNGRGGERVEIKRRSLGKKT